MWGAMSATDVSPLCSLNATVYEEVLDNFLLPAVEDLFGDADFTCQQDLAPPHTAKTTKKWFEHHQIGQIGWSAYSPDLNSTEDLSGTVKKTSQRYRPTTLEQLKCAITLYWQAIPPGECDRLICSMPRRLEAVIGQR